MYQHLQVCYKFFPQFIIISYFNSGIFGMQKLIIFNPQYLSHYDLVFFLIEKWFLLDRLQKCADLKSQLQGNTLDMQEDYWILRLFSGI